MDCKDSLPVRPIRLGPFTLDHPFILAPMAGITNSPFRRLMRKKRSSLVISELVSANGMEYASTRTLNLLKFHEDERIVGLQIFSENQTNLIKGCQVVERLGADFVDLNLGCPVQKIVKKGAGAALCRDPIQLGKILLAMVKSVKIPVTIKIRLGWDESHRNALEVIRVAHECGVSWVAVHGRTRAQGYSGQSDWNFIAELKAKSPLPILGNGDLFTPELALKRYQESGVDAVLIGRGALRNPFIFEQAYKLYLGQSYQKPQFEDYLEHLQLQRTFLEQTFQPSLALLHARKFLAWYAAGFPGCHEFRRRIFTSLQGEELWIEAERFFEKSITQRDLAYLSEPFLMGGHG